MGFKEIISSLFGQKTADPARTEYTVTGGAAYVPVSQSKVELQRIAVTLCKDYIASAISKCEMRTFLQGKEIFGDEYYLWNVRPNPNQTSTEFWREVIYRLYEENEVLIVPVQNSMLIADGFAQKEYALYPTVFSGITRGTLKLDGVYDSSTAIYLTLSESMRPQSLISGISELLNNTLETAVKKYKLDGGEHGIYESDAVAMGDDKDNKQAEKQVYERFKDYFNNENAVLKLNSGEKYTMLNKNNGQKTSIVNDITALLEQAIVTSAQAYKIPPTLILGTVADTKTAVTNFLTFCIDPLLDMITEAINAVRYGKEVLKGSYIMADTSCIEHIDALNIAGNLDKLKGAGLFSTNEIRRKINEPGINEAWADEYTLTKNYEHEGAATHENNEEEKENEKR